MDFSRVCHFSAFPGTFLLLDVQTFHTVVQTGTDSLRYRYIDYCSHIGYLMFIEPVIASECTSEAISFGREIVFEIGVLIRRR